MGKNGAILGKMSYIRIICATFYDDNWNYLQLRGIRNP